MINSDKNKLKLYAELSKNKLKESFNVNDIPEFIRSFLKEKSYNKHFHVADKCGKWLENGSQPLVMKEIKKYDAVKKDSVLSLTLVNMDLPEKELNFFGLGENTAVLALKNGGIKQCEEVLIFKFKDNQIIDFWFNIKRKPSLNFGEVLEFIKMNKERYNSSC